LEERQEVNLALTILHSQRDDIEMLRTAFEEVKDLASASGHRPSEETWEFLFRFSETLEFKKLAFLVDRTGRETFAEVASANDHYGEIKYHIDFQNKLVSTFHSKLAEAQGRSLHSSDLPH